MSSVLVYETVLVPLVVGDTLVAVVTLYTAAPEGFTADHARLVHFVAPHLATAIDAAVRIQSGRRETVHQPGPGELRLAASR
ncbi:MAG: GAF domain-containing protein [Acidobacteriota bacterium]